MRERLRRGDLGRPRVRDGTPKDRHKLRPSPTKESKAYALPLHEEDAVRERLRRGDLGRPRVRDGTESVPYGGKQSLRFAATRQDVDVAAPMNRD